jgi:type IV pilus assembly protein PilO
MLRKMQISKREKVLLFVLLVAVILFGYYNYVYLNQSAKVQTLKEEKQKLDTKLRTLNAHINSIQSRESDIKILNSKIQDKSKLLYPVIAQEKIIVELDNLMSKSNVTGTIGFSEAAVQPLEEKKQEQKKIENSSLQQLVDLYNSISKDSTKGSVAPQATVQPKPQTNAQANSQTSANPNKVEQMKVTLAFRGSYSNVIKFIENIESHTKKLAINKLNLSQSAKDEVSGTFEIEFYAVPKLSNEDEEYMKWSYNNSYGKSNPFDGGSAVSFSSTIEDSSIVKKDPYDFVMSVRSISSDLPTIMLGRANDSARNTYVYADSNSNENVEIYLTKKDDKYFYKYKTSKGTYPMQFAGEGIEFKPGSGSIGLKVYSNRKTTDSDKAGANIKIVNNTDKVVNVSVENDDNASPRVNITGEGSSVDVKKN